MFMANCIVEDICISDASTAACSKEQLSNLDYGVQRAMPSRLGQLDDVVLGLSALYHRIFDAPSDASVRALKVQLAILVILLLGSLSWP
ncbi:unnamed protein product [Haemonchus placei]|uniref:NR LBD domain-containing protein n=1 Tax=Haemonchus placei TaxID=6290 RepID=A0A0N4WML0_HAEPC|nr:unnamed protein product [Haemonchus placei]